MLMCFPGQKWPGPFSFFLGDWYASPEARATLVLAVVQQNGLAQLNESLGEVDRSLIAIVTPLRDLDHTMSHFSG